MELHFKWDTFAYTYFIGMRQESTLLDPLLLLFSRARSITFVHSSSYSTQCAYNVLKETRRSTNSTSYLGMIPPRKSFFSSSFCTTNVSTVH